MKVKASFSVSKIFWKVLISMSPVTLSLFRRKITSYQKHITAHRNPSVTSGPKSTIQVYQNRIKYNFPPLPPFISSVISRIASEPKRG